MSIVLTYMHPYVIVLSERPLSSRCRDTCECLDLSVVTFQGQGMLANLLWWAAQLTHKELAQKAVLQF